MAIRSSAALQSGRSATAACPLKPDSLRGKTLVQRVRITTKPAHPDRICHQTSVSFPPTVGAKYRQDVPFGTAAWQAMYATARNTIEGFNGYVKDGPHEALGNATRRRLRGRTAQHFLTALLVMAANIRKLRTFLDNCATSSQTQRPRRKRRRETLTDYLPVSSRPPPAAQMPNAA
jgi:hypothetical protein